MTSQRHRIVVGLDLTEFSEIVVEHAIDQAARHDEPELHFLSVVDDEADFDATKVKLAELVLPSLDGLDCTNWHVRLHVRAGKPAEEITSLAAELRAHLIVIGRFGASHPHRRIGLEAGQIIDLATCPTYVVALNDQAPDFDAQCPDCVTLRAESDGERWFCDAHRGERARLSTIVVPGASSLGGLMW
jgi:nucleotide-binding universal stress UspA family protein